MRVNCYFDSIPQRNTRQKAKGRGRGGDEAMNLTDQELNRILGQAYMRGVAFAKRESIELLHETRYYGKDREITISDIIRKLDKTRR